MRSQHVARGLTAWIMVPLLATSCAFLIPENPSSPRYNKVVGERRVPQENMKTMQGVGPQSMSAPVAPVMQAPMAEPSAMIDTSPAVAPAPAPIASMDLPPVDPMTQRIAAERLQAEGRSVPSENIQTASSDYPQLNQVPPAPPRTGPDSDAERLRLVREQLERDRAAASATTQQVLDAAAREPSMLGPNGSVPAPEPIMSVHVPAPQSSNVPVNVPSDVRGSIATLPPPPPVFSAPAPQVASAPPAPIQMDALPMGAPAAPAPQATMAAMEPIVLRPPVVATPAPAFVPTPPPAAPSYRSMPTAAGSFDPMAGATASYASSSNGYLPASRYRR